MNIRKKSKLTQKKRREKSADALKKMQKVMGNYAFLQNPEHVLETLSKNGMVTGKHDKIMAGLKLLHNHGVEVSKPSYQYVRSEKAVVRKEKNRAALNARLADRLAYLEGLGFSLNWMEAEGKLAA